MVDFLMKNWWLMTSLAILLFFILVITLISCNQKISELKKQNAQLTKKLGAQEDKKSDDKASIKSEVDSAQNNDKAKSEQASYAADTDPLDPENEEADFEEEGRDEHGEHVKYTVSFDRLKNSWVIKKSGSDRVTRRVATKVEAMSVVRELCKKHDATMSIRKKDGKFQKH